MGEGKFNQRMAEQRRIEISIPADQVRAVRCACGGEHYAGVFEIKEIPMFYTVSGKTERVPVQVPYMACVRCGQLMGLGPVAGASAQAPEEASGKEGG